MKKDERKSSPLAQWTANRFDSKISEEQNVGAEWRDSRDGRLGKTKGEEACLVP